MDLPFLHKGYYIVVGMDGNENESPLTCQSMSAVDVPPYTKYVKYEQWPVLMNVKDSQRCKKTTFKKKKKYECSNFLDIFF